MEKEKLYEIKNGAVTLYVDKWLGKEFRFKAFTVESDKDNYFVESNISDRYCPDNRKSVHIEDYLYKLYKAEADVQLRNYIDKNINRYDFYNETDNNDFKFWGNVINNAGLEPLCHHHCELNFSELTEGIVRIVMNHIHCRYSFVEKKTLEYIPPSYAKSEKIKSALEVMYSGKLNEYLALEQYRLGLAVPAYDELAKLREFLKDKKSVKLVMKSRKIHELKKDSLQVTDILKHFSYDDKLCFWLNNDYWLKPRIEQCQPLEQLDYLQHGKHQHYINREKLSKYTESHIRKGA
jgi:hypothetical protein